jgi:hypothetical protein
LGLAYSHQFARALHDERSFHPLGTGVRWWKPVENADSMVHYWILFVFGGFDFGLSFLDEVRSCLLPFGSSGPLHGFFQFRNVRRPSMD